MPLPIIPHLQTENRKLRKLNAEMLVALRDAVTLAGVWDDNHPIKQRIRAVIAKAEKDGHG
jgi:hypothetical protein